MVIEIRAIDGFWGPITDKALGPPHAHYHLSGSLLLVGHQIESTHSLILTLYVFSSGKGVIQYLFKLIALWAVAPREWGEILYVHLYMYTYIHTQ